MAETEVGQTWVSTGRGGAGNFPYTPRALAKRPVTLNTPQGREVDYRRQSIARSGRGGVGYWEPTPDEAAKQQQAEDFERDQDVIKERASKRQSLNTDGTYVWKSGRGGAGNINSPTEKQLPTTATEGAALERVHSYGRGGSNFRYGDAIPMVDMNKMESQERIEAKNRPPSVSSNGESGLATFASYASAFFNALTPAENRIENMSPTSSSSPTTPSSASSKRSPVIGGGGRGGAGNYGYATYKPRNQVNPTAGAQAASPVVPPTPAPAVPAPPSRAHVRDEHSYSGYAASYGQAYDPEMPVTAGSSSGGASGSGASSSRTVRSSLSSWA